VNLLIPSIDFSHFSLSIIDYLLRCASLKRLFGQNGYIA